MRALWLGCLVVCFAIVVGCYAAVAEDKEMPKVVTIIVCKVKPTPGPADQNAEATGDQNLDWDMTDGKLHCRQIPTEVTSLAESQGEKAPEWSPYECQRTAMMLGPQWDTQHPSSKYRFHWVACPTPIHASKDASSPIVGWVATPSCPYKDGTVICDVDSAI